MYYVYLLLLNDGRIYTGQSDNLKQRIVEHRKGNTLTTKSKQSKLIYYEAYQNKQDALDREKFLKTGDGRKQIRKQLKHFLQKGG